MYTLPRLFSKPSYCFLIPAKWDWVFLVAFPDAFRPCQLLLLVTCPSYSPIGKLREAGALSRASVFSRFNSTCSEIGCDCSSDCFVNAFTAVLTRSLSPGKPATPSHALPSFRQAWQTGTDSVFSCNRGFRPKVEAIAHRESAAGDSQ